MVRLTEEELKKRVWKLLSDSIGDNHPVDFLEERGYSVVHTRGLDESKKIIINVKEQVTNKLIDLENIFVNSAGKLKI